MSLKFLRRSATGRTAAASVLPSTLPGPRHTGLHLIDWRAARRADRACCCTARPAVIAVIPPGPGRLHQSDLLLCGHHYRVSRPGLAAARATILNMDAVPIAGVAWLTADTGP